MDHVQTTHKDPSANGETRRSFYVAAIYGIWGLITAALAAPALVYLLVPPRMRRQSDWVDAGDLAQVPAGTPVEVTFRRNRVDGWKVSSEKGTAWVLKNANNQVVAYGPDCTHLGCAYHWDTGKNEFVCPCHNSIFAADGRVIGGPAPRPLDRFETRVDKGKLLLGRLQQAPEKSA
jgi:menaquinol-cytochrome c reductase iron-sulfur subunit